MTEAIMESDEGPAIAYHLAKNPELAEKISTMSRTAAALEIGSIRAELIAERKKGATRVASKVPPPVPKIEGSADAALPKRIDDPNLSDAEFNRMRRKQIAARSRF